MLLYEPGGHRHLVCHCLLVEVGDDLVLVDGPALFSSVPSPADPILVATLVQSTVQNLPAVNSTQKSLESPQSALARIMPPPSM